MALLRSYPGRGYRQCVGIALFNHAGLVFLGKRNSRGVVPQYSWQMPQGGIDHGEAPETAARRELREETNVEGVSLLGEIDGWLHYDLPAELTAWRGRYRGQAQRWFAYRFEGEDGAVNVVDPPDGHPQEFARWRWEALAHTPEVVVPFKRPVYEYVAEAFAKFAGPTEPLHEAQPRAI